MVHLVISAEAWAALPGNRIPDGFGGFTVAPVPAPPAPGQLASNASHATIYLHREAADLHRRYLGYVAFLRAALLDSLGTDIQVMLRDPTHDMVILSIPQIMVVLSDSYGTASAADVQALLSQLSTPIPGGDHDTFVSFTVAFRQIIAALERAGQPLSQYLQCRHLRMATASQPTIARAVTLYFEKAPLLADQCLTDLIAFVRLQLQNAVSTLSLRSPHRRRLDNSPRMRLTLRSTSIVRLLTFTVDISVMLPSCAQHSWTAWALTSRSC